MITSQDKQLLSAKGITVEQVQHQLERFQKGFPFLQLAGAASVGEGILALSDAQQLHYQKQWDEYMKQAHQILKFVPASGAATRMFKGLFSFLACDATTPIKGEEAACFDKMEQFAFYEELNECCCRLYGEGVASLCQKGEHKKVVEALLHADGMNYGALPKGLLKFHQCGCEVRTPVEEHLVEAALYATGHTGKAAVHFTVSKEHRGLFRTLVDKVVGTYAKAYGVEYTIGFSEQKECTDTVAVTLDNEPFREEGQLVFRPGGHGALIENLNELSAEVIFIKNIDNVVPDKLKEVTTKYKKILGGILVEVQAQTFHYLELLDKGCSKDQLQEIRNFMEQTLCCKAATFDEWNETAQRDFLKQKLNRPIRVCGMVKNVGEPGGGPFWAYNADGTVSLQILESSQIDMKDPVKKKMFEEGTHFNPVDLVCGVCDYKGQKFDLTQYTDPETGFISYKSKGGRDLKALELPGLWNGAMSNWNTLFVEVPLQTFNPVKTINDLLREEHQS